MIIESLKYLCLAVIISGFTVTMAIACVLALAACVRSSQISQEQGE